MIDSKLEQSNAAGCRLRLLRSFVRCDDRLITADELDSAVVATAAALAHFRGRRIALLAQRADQIMVALTASELAQCQVLLCRTPELTADLIQEWNIAAVVDSSMAVRPTKCDGDNFSDFSVLVMTSGTTGRPKLAQHSIDALLGRIRPAKAGRSPQKWLLTYHPATYGGLQVLLSCIINGTELITTSNPTVANLCEVALRYHPSSISGTPTFWRSFLLVLGPGASDLKLQQITLGGEIADAHILKALRRAYPAASISHIYASTEAGALFSVRDGLPGFPAAWINAGVEGVQLRIRDGVLQVKSPRGMTRYVVGAPTPGVTEDGWLITGDLVEQAGDRIYFAGRQDTMLNLGGAKVRPEEVEQVLLGLPEIVDARVYGVRNPITGVVLAADLVAQPGRDVASLRATLPAKLRATLEHYKVPRILNFVGSISMSEAGKKKLA